MQVVFARPCFLAEPGSICVSFDRKKLGL
jgi:hypothetical protein